MPLALDAIVAALGTRARRFDIDVLASCDSTNAVLLARAEAGAPSGSVVVAAQQTAGRGRRGRQWLSAPGDSLTFSLFWRFAPGTAPAGLSLAVGLAVAQGIRKVDARATPLLKWPNDLLLDGRKLGGILIELLPGAAHAAIIGIGLNLRLPDAMPAELRAQSASLSDVGDVGSEVDAAVLLAAILGELLDTLESFGRAGFAALRPAWNALHAHQDRPVRLLSDFAAPRAGICRGVDADGALLFEEEGAGGHIERVLSGEISLRGA